MSKHKQYFQKMLEENKQLFNEFEEIHSKYHLEPKKFQEEFNQIGDKALDLIREYENRLCSHSEGGKYGKYSARLAEKFQALVKNRYPKIDFVGVTTSKPFSIEKINFS
jgi:sugar-specific transcriptional regulator TrmB